MAFKKLVRFSSELVQTIFNESNAILWAINGRLSGFFPTPVGGDLGSPGIASTTSGTNTIRTITLTLAPPTTADDLRYSQLVPGSQPTSTMIANGVQVIANAPVSFIGSITDTSGVTLDNPDHITVYASYDASNADPAFGVARASVLDASPLQIAKLAIYNPSTKQWDPSPQVSVGGLIAAINSVLESNGGFPTLIASALTLQVGPGAIVGQYGRVINGSIQLVSEDLPVTSNNYRKDLLVVVDPFDETNTLPTFKLIKGIEGPAVTISSPTPRSTSAKEIPIAEVLVYNGGSVPGIVKVVDTRPILAWQTDAMIQSAPSATAQINVSCLQPGVSMTDTTQAVNKAWSVAVFRGFGSGGGAAGSKFAIGLVGPLANRLFLGPTTPGAYSPTTSDFPAAPYVTQRTFQVISQPGGPSEKDVTNDPTYAVKFDFLNGVFTASGITTQIANEVIKVVFQQAPALFAIDETGTVNLPALNAFYAHVDPSNPAAHTAANILYNLAVGAIPGLSGDTASVEACLAALGAAIAGTGGGGGSGGASDVSTKNSVVFHFGRGKMTQSSSLAEYALIAGVTGASSLFDPPAGTGKIKVRPGHTMIRAGRITGLSLSVDHEDLTDAGGSGQSVQASVYINGASTPALVTPDTALASNDGGGGSGTSFVVSPLSGAPQVAAGDKLAATFTYSLPLVNAAVRWQGVMVDIEVTYD